MKNQLIIDYASDFLGDTLQRKLRETAAERNRFLARVKLIDAMPDSMAPLRKTLHDREVERYEAAHKRICDSYEKSFRVGAHLLRVGNGETTKTYWEETHS